MASAFALFALLHFADHVIRGELVVARGLDPLWNHSGWPFNTQSSKPYIFPMSFLVVFGLTLGGILFTFQGRLHPGYWLATSFVLTSLLVLVHFVGFSSGAAETPNVICQTYRSNAPRVLAMIDLFALFALLIAVAIEALRIRRRLGRW